MFFFFIKKTVGMQPQRLSRQKNISALPLQPNVCDDQVTLSCSPLAVCLTQKMYILAALQSKIRSLLFSLREKLRV